MSKKDVLVFAVILCHPLAVIPLIAFFRGWAVIPWAEVGLLALLYAVLVSAAYRGWGRRS